jgi:uncharacterized protein YbjT (DUF2867 family)
MHIAIAGAHGQVALRLTRLLTKTGDTVTGLIRNPDHADDVSQAGGSPVLCDLELASVDDLATAIRGADAVIFAAGAGPGSGGPRKLTMDRDGAIKLCRAASAAGVKRYVMISGAPGWRTRPQATRSSKSTCVPRPKLTRHSLTVNCSGRSSAPGA